MDLVQRIEQTRVLRQMSKRGLARQAGIHDRHLYRILTGQRPNLAAETVVRLCIALETTPDYLLGFKDAV